MKRTDRFLEILKRAEAAKLRGERPDAMPIPDFVRALKTDAARIEEYQFGDGGTVYIGKDGDAP